MKIKLRNFRCHTNAQFELQDSGLILLSGNSGAGKSTLLKAILYALYGNKAVRKPCSFGVMSCSVTLEFMGMKIHRTNRPNRVVVNDNLEDAAAQAYIDEKLGVGYDEFLISSYIPQKNNTSVLSIAQTEQLRLIKTLAFEGEQNELHKEKIKEMIRESSTILVQKRTETQFAQREVDRIRESLFPTEFPLTVSNGETEDTAIENYRERMRSFNKRMEAFLETKTGFSEELQNHVYAKAELDMTTEKLNGVNNHLVRIEARLKQLEIVLEHIPADLKDKMKLTNMAIQYLELYKEHFSLQQQYDHIKEEEAHERDTQREQLVHVLWKHRGREKDHQTAREELDAYQEQLRVWQQYQDATHELQKLQKELELEVTNKDAMVDHYTQLIEQLSEEKAGLYRQKEQLVVAAEKLAFEREIVHCPECEAPLRWQDSTLVSVHDHQPVEERDYEAEIKTVEKDIRNIDKKKAVYESVLRRIHAIIFPALQKTDSQVYNQMRQQVQMLTTYISQNIQREEELVRIQHESEETYITPALKSLQQKLSEKQLKLDSLLKILGSGPTEEIDELRTRHHDMAEQVERYQEHTEEKAQVLAELEELGGKYKHYLSQVNLLKQQVAGVNSEAIRKKVTMIDRDIAKSKKKQAEDEELGEKVDQYLVYREELAELNRWETQLAEIIKEFKVAEKVHTAHLTIKEKYTQAEIMTLESTIHSINEHTRYYLETFFADHQLTATLEAAHKGKKIQSLKVNTVINYKGNEYDNINQMSGGEFDRCTLASICGINSMLGSPILILDESLASLDADNNTEIIQFLSELAQDKLILVCSHEAVRGIFDEIIEM